MKPQTEMIIKRLRKHLNHPKNPKTVTETSEIENMTRQAVEYFVKRYEIEIWAKGSAALPKESMDRVRKELIKNPRASYREIGKRTGVSHTKVMRYDKLLGNK